MQLSNGDHWTTNWINWDELQMEVISVIACHNNTV